MTTHNSTDPVASSDTVIGPVAALPKSVEESPRKRQRPATTKKQRSTTSSAGRGPSIVVSSSAGLPISKTLIIDNGGDTVKYGWSTDKEPRYMENVTARLAQQWTVLVGNQLRTMVRNPNQLVGLTRSMERGIIVNMGNQIQVWKHILDTCGVAVPLQTEAAQAFGWKRTSNIGVGKNQSALIAPASCAVLLTVPPFCPRIVLDAILQVWMEDLGFGHVGLCVSTACARQEHPKYHSCLTVDLGWSATQIVPTMGCRICREGVRRVPLGGRHLINMYKYYFSYRQWNLMDQEWILRDILEKAGYVSLRFKDDMLVARKMAKGRRPFDRDYVLPDYQETFVGSIQLPLPLLKQQALLQGDATSDNDDEEEDSSVDEKDLMEEDIEDDGQENEWQERPSVPEAEGESDDAGTDDEAETLEEARARLLKQRAAEEQRRRELEAEQQVLHLSVERFSVPECLFRPSDASLPSEMAGIHHAIVASVEACERYYQPALYQSIYLVGGLAQLEGTKERLEQDLRSLVPCEYPISITIAHNPTLQAWKGACAISEGHPSSWSISREAWEACKRKGAWKQFVENGLLV